MPDPPPSPSSAYREWKASGIERWLDAQSARQRARPPQVIRSRQAQHSTKAFRRPAARPMPPGLDVPDRPRIEPGPGCDLLLGQPQAEPGRPDPAREAVSFRNEPRSQGRLDGRPAGGQGFREASLPAGHALVPATQLNREGSLRQSPVHPALADPLTERPRLVRITSWEHTGSTPHEAQIAERQRNGVAVVGSDIRDAAAAARRRRSHSIMRE